MLEGGVHMKIGYGWLSSAVLIRPWGGGRHEIVARVKAAETMKARS
jgi:hypothetical protein